MQFLQNYRIFSENVKVKKLLRKSRATSKRLIPVNDAEDSKEQSQEEIINDEEITEP